MSPRNELEGRCDGNGWRGPDRGRCDGCPACDVPVPERAAPAEEPEGEFIMHIPATNETCMTCHGARWVCVDHPNLPGPCGTPSDDTPTCSCDAHECTPCPTCNYPSVLGVRRVAPALPRGMTHDA